MNESITRLALSALPPLLVGLLCLALAARAVREVARRVPSPADVHPRIAALRAESLWPGLRRSVRVGAIVATIVLLGGTSLVTAGSILAAYLGMVSSLWGVFGLLIIVPCGVALAAIIVRCIEHAAHLILDVLDAKLRSAVSPPISARSPDA